MTKNPPSLYGYKYVWIQGMRKTSRAIDNGIFYGTAITTQELVRKLGYPDGSSVVDVGCGRGFVVRHLQNLGYNAYGVEYGPLEEVKPIEEVKNKVRWGDLTDELPFIGREFGGEVVNDRPFKLALCLGVLSHLPEDKVVHALKEIERIADALFTNILCGENIMQQHHLTIHPAEWWGPRFEEAGWKDAGYFQWLKDRAMNVSPGQWAEVWTR